MKVLLRQLATVLLAAALLPSAAQAAAGKLNVLFIATDDWRVELGCYGTPDIKTPVLDKFSKSAVRFDRAYCQFPLCNPSRTSLLTGRHPQITTALDNTVAFRDINPDWVTLPQHFKNNGYAAVRTGKIYHGGIDDPKAWTEVIEGGVGAGKSQAKKDVPAAKGDAKKKKGQDPAQSDRIVVLEGDGESHLDYHTALRGVQLLEKYKDQPFFIAVGFAKPHSPPTAPKKFFDLYDPKKIQLPPDFAPRPTVPAGFPAASVPLRSSDLFIGRDASEDEAREVIRAYRASASFTDWNIGRVLDALDRLKLADNTIVVYFGDHGYHLGEKGKWSKHNSLFEVAARVPLMVRQPGVAGNGKPCGRTVQLLDLYPTLADLCDLPKMDGLGGHSFASLLRDPQSAWTHPAFTVARNAKAFGQSVRTERWRYSEWDGGASGAVLFDHENDPHEMKNLAQDAKQAATVAEMKKLLKAGLPAPPKSAP
jgi:iduronate 2-sulfatase